jgi:hypothetical protein
MSTTDNKELVRRLVQEVVNERNLDAIDELAAGPVARAARGWIGPFRESETHEGEWRGRPATGRRFENVDEIYVFRAEDGKLAGTTAIVEDNLTRMKQLGFEL